MGDEKLRGRVFLWSNALASSEECLDIADLVENAARCEPIASEPQARLRFFEEKTGRTFDPPRCDAGDGDIMEAYPRNLPFPHECERASDHLRKLAIIYFIQVYKDGNSAPGVAKNRNTAIDELRKALECLAFPEAEDLAKFNLLRAQLETVRDRQLGHADGKTFHVQHGRQIISGRTPGSSIQHCTDLRLALRRLLPAASQLQRDLRRGAK